MIHRPVRFIVGYLYIMPWHFQLVFYTVKHWCLLYSVKKKKKNSTPTDYLKICVCVIKQAHEPIISLSITVINCVIAFENCTNTY